MAMLAARPYISEFRSLSELRFDDDAAPVTNTVSMPAITSGQNNRPPHKRKIFSRLLPKKSAVSKVCNVQ